MKGLTEDQAATIVDKLNKLEAPYEDIGYYTPDEAYELAIRHAVEVILEGVE